MSEYIRKEDAIAELNKWEWQELYLPIHFKENILDVLPTYSFPNSEKGVPEFLSKYEGEWVSADREKGEWIKIQSGDDKFPESIVCSKCKNENSHLDFDEHGEPIGKVFITSKFCPNCGADMKGDKE